MVSKISLDLYNNLKRTGKPTTNEWTVLSTIIIEDEAHNLDVVALGTGTKCIGKSQMSKEGIILNDSHAEVICRRAFMKYLYNQMLFEQSKVVERSGNVFKVLDGLKFHMYSSLMPCGDASIFPKSYSNCGNLIQEETIVGEGDIRTGESIIKRPKLDIYRTGAKCLPFDSNTDTKQPGSDYHVLGSVRTKPGRGDPTVSASCSDKIAKWIELGIQGSYLSLLLDKPIYLASITIGNEIFNKDALERALYKRFDSDMKTDKETRFNLHVPELQQCIKHKFISQKCDEKQPAPTSIIFVKDSKVEVAVDGYKQGATKKNRLEASGRIKICKKELHSSFMVVAEKIGLKFDCNLSYSALKHSTEYYKRWCELKNKKFKVWPNKIDCIQEVDRM